MPVWKFLSRKCEYWQYVPFGEAIDGGFCDLSQLGKRVIIALKNCFGLHPAV
jgi:hypothetical protein